MNKIKQSEGDAVCCLCQSPIFEKSLEINIVPQKTCPFDCIYCRCQALSRKSIDPIDFVPIDGIKYYLKQALGVDSHPEYLVLSGKGDPSLYKKLIPLLREIRSMTDVPIAVVSSGGVLWRHDVQHDLSQADVVFAIIDTANTTAYHYINRPIDAVPFKRYLRGILDFSLLFKGRFWLQVTLLNGINAIEAEIKKLADVLGGIKVDKIFVRTDSYSLGKEIVPPLKNEELAEFARYFGNNTVVIEPKQASERTFDFNSEKRKGYWVFFNIKRLAISKPHSG